MFAFRADPNWWMVLVVPVLSALACLNVEPRDIPERLLIVADTFNLSFTVDSDVTQFGQAIVTTSLDTLGYTPVILLKRTFQGSQLGEVHQQSIHRFPDFEPLHTSSASSDRELSMQFTPDYIDVVGYDRSGDRTRVVPRGDVVQSELGVELWVRAAPLTLSTDTVLTTYAAASGPGSLRVQVEGVERVLTPRGVRMAWKVRGEDAPSIVRHWWIDVDNRRVLRHTLTTWVGVTAFTLP
jgi:hypothetical protein